MEAAGRRGVYLAMRLRPTSYETMALQPLVEGILNDVALCAVATVNGDGTAHIYTAFFCVDDEWRVFFMSDEETQHSANIAARPSMALAVYSSKQGWDDWKAGLQFFGTCAMVQGRDARVGAELYRQRFPSYASWVDALGRTSERSGAPALFMFVPESLKILHEEVLGEETFVTVSLARD